MAASAGVAWPLFEVVVGSVRHVHTMSVPITLHGVIHTVRDGSTRVPKVAVRVVIKQTTCDKVLL